MEGKKAGKNERKKEGGRKEKRKKGINSSVMTLNLLIKFLSAVKVSAFNGPFPLKCQSPKPRK